MRKKYNIATSALACLLLTFGATTAHGICPAIQKDELTIKQNFPEIEEIVFFASWCGSCEASLKEADSKKTMLVAVFDDASSAASVYEKAFRGQKKRPLCRVDVSGLLGERHGVKSLPTKVLLEKKK